jgi:hypothetical protein
MASLCTVFKRPQRANEPFYDGVLDSRTVVEIKRKIKREIKRDLIKNTLHN